MGSLKYDRFLTQRDIWHIIKALDVEGLTPARATNSVPESKKTDLTRRFFYARNSGNLAPEHGIGRAAGSGGDHQ